MLHTGSYNSNYKMIMKNKKVFLDTNEFELQFDFKINLHRYKFNKNFLKALLLNLMKKEIKLIV